MSQPATLAAGQMTFDDEFTGFTASADGARGWMTTYPYGGEAAHTLTANSEAEYYANGSAGKSPFSLSKGVLSITASNAAPGSNPYKLPYTSGLITTYTSFAQTYGVFEVRAQLPAGQGLWPAFWLLPSSGAYTSELDVFEQLGNDPATIYATTHGSTGGVWSSNLHAVHMADTSKAFHTYAVDWEPKTTGFFVDGRQVASVATPASMNQPMYMLLNLAVGGAGSWPGAASPGSIPATMKIDWVRAYATANTRDISGALAIHPPGRANGMVGTPPMPSGLSLADWSAAHIELPPSSAAALSALTSAGDSPPATVLLPGGLSGHVAPGLLHPILPPGLHHHA